MIISPFQREFNQERAQKIWSMDKEDFKLIQAELLQSKRTGRLTRVEDSNPEYQLSYMRWYIIGEAIIVSIGASHSHYCHPREGGLGNIEKYDTVEMAAMFMKSQDWISGRSKSSPIGWWSSLTGGDDVAGWVTWDQVNQLVKDFEELVCRNPLFALKGRM